MEVERWFTASASIQDIIMDEWREIYESLMRYFVCIKGWVPSKASPEMIRVDPPGIDAKLLVSYDDEECVVSVTVSAGDASLVESLLDEIVSFVEAGSRGR